MSNSEASDNLIESDIQEGPDALLEDLVARKDDINKAKEDKIIDLRQSDGVTNEMKVQCEQHDH